MVEDEDERPTRAMDVIAADDVDEGDTTTTSEDRLGPGAEVAGYVIDGELGKGGMGVVYSAQHPLIGKRAAIKVLKPELSKEPAAVERFVREARAVNQIGHPNIVDIFDFGTLDDGRSYYVMDLLTGESLRARLRRGPLHVSEAATVIDEIASALIAAHDKGIVHRDLKPDNVFMVRVPGRWPEAKLLDWGLLKLVAHNAAAGSYRTLAGSVMGTPIYMSPEQARASDTVDHRTDIYALGVMAYEVLAGAAPFKRASSLDTMVAHQEDPVPPLAARVPGLPEELCQLVEAMLAKHPDDRPSLPAVRAVLKRLRGTQIPTMTAAGLVMPQAPLRFEPATGSFPTHDERAGGQTIEERPSAPSLPPPPVPMPAIIPLATPPAMAAQHTPHGMQAVPSYVTRPSGSMNYAGPPTYARVSQQEPTFPSAAGLLPLDRAERADQQPGSKAWMLVAALAIAAILSGIITAIAC